MARTIRNTDSYITFGSTKGRKAVQVRTNRRNRHAAKQALIAGREIEVVRHSVDWDLH